MNAANTEPTTKIRYRGCDYNFQELSNMTGRPVPELREAHLAYGSYFDEYLDHKRKEKKETVQ